MIRRIVRKNQTSSNRAYNEGYERGYRDALRKTKRSSLREGYMAPISNGASIYDFDIDVSDMSMPDGSNPYYGTSDSADGDHFAAIVGVEDGSLLLSVTCFSEDFELGLLKDDSPNMTNARRYISQADSILADLASGMDPESVARRYGLEVAY